MTVVVNAYATLRAPPPLTVAHTRMRSRDRSDPELAEHIHGFIGFVLQGGKREMTQTVYHVVRHIERVQTHLSFQVDEEQLGALARWAIEANAIFFLPDGTVRDPTCRVLIEPDGGAPEQGARVPYPPDAIERKHRHDAHLRSRGILVAETLPPVVGEGEVVLRARPHVVHRATALAIVALRAESLNIGTPIPARELQARIPDGFAALTPIEKSFVDDDSPTEQQVTDHGWRYEALWLLEWALGLVDALPDPTAVCDAALAANAILQADRASLLASNGLRPVGEILDALDLHLRMHWAAREAARTATPLAGLQPSILRERHYALNWLTRFEGADWDDVDTPT